MSFKHANTNPGLWINVVSLIVGIIAVAVNDEWVKQNPGVVVILGMLNFCLTGLLQYLRDANKPKPVVVETEEKKQIVSTSNINIVTQQEKDAEPEKLESTTSMDVKDKK